MTKGFNKLFESLLKEVLIGTRKRNKIDDINHITPTPRVLNSPAHIRPVNKSIGNETGVHSKDPTSKPVYTKNGIKPNKNKSQRKFSKSPYSASHDKFGTKRNLMARREKILKSIKESYEDFFPEYYTDRDPEEGWYILYKLTPNKNDKILKSGDTLYFGDSKAKRMAHKIKNDLESDIYVYKVVVYTDNENTTLKFGEEAGVYKYVGEKMSEKIKLIATVEYEYWLK